MQSNSNPSALFMLLNDKKKNRSIVQLAVSSFYEIVLMMERGIVGKQRGQELACTTACRQKGVRNEQQLGRQEEEKRFLVRQEIKHRDQGERTTSPTSRITSFQLGKQKERTLMTKRDKQRQKSERKKTAVQDPSCQVLSEREEGLHPSESA